MSKIEKSIEVEIAGALFQPGSEMPFALSSLPGCPSPRAVVKARVNCEGRIEFRRGDATVDGRVNISDPVRILTNLFLGSTLLSCPAAADADDDGRIDLTDPVFLLAYLFLGDEAPPEPGPLVCGEDPTAELLGECAYHSCNGASK